MSVLDDILELCQNNPFIVKFLAANDIGLTGSNQYAILIPSQCWPLFFERACTRDDQITDKIIDIRWSDEEGNQLTTQSRAVYYPSKDEYRLTQLDEANRYRKESSIGSLFLMTRTEERNYSAWILNLEENIEYILDTFGIDPGKGENLIKPTRPVTETINQTQYLQVFDAFLDAYRDIFPTTEEMAEKAIELQKQFYYTEKYPDSILLKRLDIEYELFRYIEYRKFCHLFKSSCENFSHNITLAQSIFQRRSSRAGTSLEIHLGTIFKEHGLPYTWQGTSENNKKPDFIFPNILEYHNPDYPVDKLVFLGSKRTCRDRWRQILDEADKITVKHLFTIQQGISTSQINQMQDKKIRLVVPDPYINQYYQKSKDCIMNLHSFIKYVTCVLKE